MSSGFEVQNSISSPVRQMKTYSPANENTDMSEERLHVLGNLIKMKASLKLKKNRCNNNESEFQI